MDRKPQRLCGHSLALTDAAADSAANDETMVRPLSFPRRRRCFLSPAKLAASSSSSCSCSSSVKVAIYHRPTDRGRSFWRQRSLERVIKPLAALLSPLSTSSVIAVCFPSSNAFLGQTRSQTISPGPVSPPPGTTERAPFSSFVAVALVER